MAIGLVLGSDAGFGLVGSFMDVVALASTLILVLIIVAMAGIAYKSLVGDGIEWPDDVDEDGTDDGEVREGSAEDEWKYY